MKILVIGDFQGVLLNKLKKDIEKEEFDIVVAVGDYGGLKDWKPYVMEILRRSRKGEETISAKEFFGKKGLKTLLKREFESVKKILRYLDTIGKPVILIFGNSDDGWYDYAGEKLKRKKRREKMKKSYKNYLGKLKNVKIIHYGSKVARKLNFIGFGGYMDIEAFFSKEKFPSGVEQIPKRLNRHRYMRKLFFEIIKKSDNRKLKKIFVFHYPPYGVFDIIRDKRNPMDGESAGVKFFAEAVKKHKPLAVLCGHMEEYQGIKKLYGVPVINPGAAQWGRYAILDLDEEKKIRNIIFKRGKK
ncbi:metallophosphoesterase [Candidatus Pacearchaeota archaeon]|nr:metallophosphoesterase [Candidatus Pacearchaeota archaeon]